jgi:hypothetical protein
MKCGNIIFKAIVGLPKVYGDEIIQAYLYQQENSYQCVPPVPI